MVFRARPWYWHLHLSRDGELKEATLERRRNQGTEDGHWRLIPLAVTCASGREFDGYRIPAHCTAGWWPETERHFEFFEAETVTAVFRQAALESLS